MTRTYRDHSALVHGIARKVTRSDAAAEDITQEVFVSYWRNVSNFDAERGSLRTFLATIAHRRAVDWVRREQAHRAREAKHTRESPNPEGICSTTPDDAIVSHDVTIRMRECIAQLPADLRDPLLLAYFDGHCYREVAQILGIAEGTTKSRIRRGLQTLGVALARQGVHHYVDR